MSTIVQLTPAPNAHYRALVSLAETIRTAREARGWTQTALAVASGVSTRYISSMENGQNASMDVVRRVALALDLDTVPIGGGRIVDFTEAVPAPPTLGPGVQRFMDRLVALAPTERVALADLLRMFSEALEDIPRDDEFTDPAQESRNRVPPMHVQSPKQSKLDRENHRHLADESRGHGSAK